MLAWQWEIDFMACPNMRTKWGAVCQWHTFSADRSGAETESTMRVPTLISLSSRTRLVKSCAKLCGRSVRY